jgi:Raf kinase inhibitor-like YbhB/YbcL family protein
MLNAGRQGLWLGGWAFALACLIAASSAGENKTIQETAMKLQLTSPAFAEGKEIPTVHTGQGRDSSPPLKWNGVPAEAKSLALIADDPDAPVGTWVHWVLYDLPATVTELAADEPKSQFIASGAKQGINDFRRLGYGGPMPPSGKPHRYFFKLYALDKTLDLKPGATKKDLLKAMEGRVLAEGQLMGTYQKK